ncbi:FMN-binding protein [Anaerosolibacter sp.]|uniref:FMN-binding protein n=1 Tax=Anaerosolibacter sp. TaxID=1872527 RepID=UPI0039EFA51F
MKLVLKIVVSILVIFVLVAAGGMFFLTRGLDTVGSVELEGVDLSSVEDGIYMGQYDVGRWTNQVNVTIEDHKIIDIEIVEDVLFPRTQLTAGMISKIIEEQNTNIDGISGATVTSKAYLKAIENALKE